MAKSNFQRKLEESPDLDLDERFKDWAKSLEFLEEESDEAAA